MKLAQIFQQEGDSRTEEEKRFYLKSKWEPPNWKVNKSLLVHNKVIQNKFDNWKQPTRVASNVSAGLKEALKSLKNDDSIDIKMDDKSPCFVVADRKDYISSALNDLSKQSNIEELSEDVDKQRLIKEVEEEILKVVTTMMRNKEMKETTGEYILQKTKEHKVARFYCNWKCHKYEPTQTEFAHAAVRGIVSCSGTADEAVCDYLDFLLNPGMQKLRSYLKGTKDFLLWIEKLKQQYPRVDHISKKCAKQVSKLFIPFLDIRIDTK